MESTPTISAARWMRLGGLTAILWLVPYAGAGQEPPEPAAQEAGQVAADSGQVDGGEVAEQPVDSTAALREILVALDSVYDRIIVTSDSIAVADAEGAALLRLRNIDMVDSLEVLKGRMASELGSVSRDYAGVDSILGVYQDFLQLEFGLVEDGIDRRSEVLDSLRSLRATTELGDLDELEEQIWVSNAQLDTALIFIVGSIEEAEEVGIDIQAQWSIVDRFLLSRVEEQTGRLQLALAERGTIRSRLDDARESDAGEEELAVLDQRRLLTEQRIAGEANALEVTADLLDRRGLPTANYRQLMIQATGEVTSDVLDPTVAVGLVRDGLERLWIWIKEAGPNVLVQLAIVLGSILVARGGFRLAWFVFRRTGGRKGSRLLIDLVSRMLMPVASFVGLVTGLTLVGVDTTALLASLGVLGVIVGLALQDTLSNLAAGFFILLHRPYDVDDTVTAAGVTGTVRTMGLASTTIITFDNRRIFVPNNKVWGEIIENKSAEVRRRVDVLVRFPHAEDPNRVIGVADRVCAEYELVLDEPAPLVYVKAIDDSLLDLEVRAWAATSDWWTVTTQLPRRLSMAMKEEGIEPPYPRQIEYEIGREEPVPYEG
jgi:small conductance mechanosensitive channel